MAVTIKKAVLWRKELENRPGTLAETLKPLAEAGISLQVVMGYAFPGEQEHAAVEVWPIEGEQAANAAGQAGLHATPQIACLIVSGDDVAGLGHAIADRLATNGINISFVMVQAANEQYHGVFGFQSQEDADKAAQIIEEVGRAMVPERKAAPRKTTRKRAAAKTTRGKSKAKAKGKSAGAKRGARKTTGRAAGKKTGAKAGAKAGARKAKRKTTRGKAKR